MYTSQTWQNLQTKKKNIITSINILIWIYNSNNINWSNKHLQHNNHKHDTSFKRICKPKINRNDNKEFNKMIRLESLLYGLKSLLIGIPIGLLGSFCIYQAFKNSVDFGYMIPWVSILISIIFVFIIVGATMKYSLSKINKQNIIETIRQDNI